MRIKDPTSRLPIDKLNSSYTFAIQYIIKILSDYGLTWVEPKYNPLGAKCFNVCDTDGASDLVVRLDYDPEDECLTAVGESGTEYPLGDDCTGQDNYTLVGVDTLVRCVNEEVRRIHFSGLHPGYNAIQSIEGACKVIAEYIGEDGNFSFEKAFPHPDFRGAEKITSVTDKVIHTYTADANRRHLIHPLDSLLLKELKAIIEKINEYLIYVHNSAK